MATATITTATVKYPSKEPKDFGYGLKINVLLVDANNQEIRLWGKPNDTAIANLRKGQSVQVLFDGKSHKLIETTNATQPVDGVATGYV